MKSPSLELCNKRFGKNGYVIEKRKEDDKESYFVRETKPEIHRAVFPIESRANEDGSVEISITSEYPVIVFGQKEYISHDKEDVDVSRIQEVGAILLNHDPNKIVGKPTRVWLDEAARKTRATIMFDSDEDAQGVKKKVVEDKSLRGVSGGFIVRQWLWLEDENTTYKGRFTGPGWVGVGMELLEASLTPIPADPSVGVNRTIGMSSVPAPDAKEQSAEETAGKPPAEKGDRNMEKEIKAESNVPTAVNPKAETRTDEKAIVEQERNRVREITQICKRHGMDADLDKYITDGASVESVRKSALKKIEDGDQPVGSPEVLKDGRETFRSAAVDGLRMRAGHEVAKPSSGANDFRGMSLVRMAEECLRRSGVSAIPSDVRQLVTMALRGAEVIAGSSSDFPFILANTANKSLLAGYEAAPSSYQYWAAIGSLNDFKLATREKFSDVGKLKLVAEGGKYTSTAMTEKRELIQLGTYGRIWTMSRQAIINDDLDAFTRVPMSFGMQARMLPNDLAVAVLTTNAAMSDANALFSTAHANTSSETDRRLDTVAHAQAAIVYMFGLMANQRTLNADTEADGRRYLNLRPRVWLVSMTDEIIARQAVVSAADAGATYNPGIPNPIGVLSLQVVSDQNIKTSSTDYSHYLFADPRMAPVVEVAFLQGNQTPYFEQIDQTDADGRKWLIRLDCGAAAVDHVGAVREVGTD